MCVEYRLGTHRMFAGDSLPGLLTAETAENAICLFWIRTCERQLAKSKLPETMKNVRNRQFRAGGGSFFSFTLAWASQGRGLNVANG